MSSGRNETLFTKTSDNLKTLLDQVKDESVERTCQSRPFDQDVFRKQLIDASVCISHEVTKLSLLFSKPPFPDSKSVEPICSSLEMSCLSLVSVFYGFPKAQGLTLLSQIRKAVIGILQSIEGLVCDINQIEQQENKAIFLSTGSVWEVIENVKTLPKDNKEAVLKLIGVSNDLIADALSELETEMNDSTSNIEDDLDSNEDDSEDEFGNHWSSSELDICRSAAGLVKTAHACIRKTSTVISECDVKNVEAMDDVFSKADVISASVDDFVESLYRPVRKPTIMEMATSLSSNLRSLLSSIKSAALSDNNESWLEFLTKAVDHNLTKVENLTGTSRLG
ncbi:Cyclin-D1-binding protein 1 [Chamberlinius hualienensis]